LDIHEQSARRLHLFISSPRHFNTAVVVREDERKIGAQQLPVDCRITKRVRIFHVLEYSIDRRLITEDRVSRHKAVIQCRSKWIAGGEQEQQEYRG